MREYLLRSDGFTRARRLDYEHLRWLVWQMMMPHYKKGRAPGSPKAFLRFGWEEMTDEEAAERLEECKVSDEEIEELNRLIEMHHKRVNGNG